MEESGGARRENDRDEKEDIRRGIFFHVNEYDQSGVDVSELRAIKGSGGAGRESDKDEKEGAETEILFHADEYD